MNGLAGIWFQSCLLKKMEASVKDLLGRLYVAAKA
jgi:hypothetical protein